jgi:phenylacetate-CoA ligase
MPAAWTRRLEDERLAELVARCFETSPFYRRKLSAAGVRPEQVTGREELPRIPCTTREELRQAQVREPPLGGLVAADPLEIVRLQAGPAASVAYTEDDLRAAAAVAARAFWAAGVRPDDVVLNCLPNGLCEQTALETAGAAAVPIGLDGTMTLLAAGRTLAPTALLAAAGDALDLAEEIGAAEVELQKLLVAGDPGSARSRLEELSGAIVRSTFGLPEVCTVVAAECEEGDGLHFLGQGVVLAEVVDPETGAALPVEAGTRGELVLTHVVREGMPLLRVRTRQTVWITATECPCGRTGFRFRPSAGDAPPG